MSWIKNLFQRKSKKVMETKNTENQINDSDKRRVIPEDLFIESQTPIVEDKTPRKENVLKAFLNKEYFNKGFELGYQFHSEDILDQIVKKTKSEFILLIDQVIDEKNLEISELRKYKFEVKGISENRSKQIDQKISEFQSSIQTLKDQKNLSSNGDGWVMVPVNVFKLGFMQGFEKYIEVKTLAISTGLFS